MTTLYHATRLSALDGILAEGLDPARSQSSLAAVFLTDVELTAANYSCMRDGEHVMLAVDLASLDRDLLGPDNYELPDLLERMDADDLERLGYYDGVTWSEVSWQDSLAVASQVAYHGVIPPAAIRVVDSECLPDPRTSARIP